METACHRKNCRRRRHGDAAVWRRRKRRAHGGGKIAAVWRRREPVFTGGNKRGQDTKYGFLSPLDSPYLPLRCDSLRSRSEMRGAHRDVWCSKGTPLMEAELFAAERGRPALSGRALVCAANHASKIQGSSAAYKLKDARNRATVTPVSLHISDVSAQRKVRGVKRGLVLI